MRHRFFSRLNYLENRLVAARVRPMLCRRRQDHSQLCELTTRKLDRRNPVFWLVVRVGFPGCIKQHYTEHRARGGSQCSATSRRIPSPTGCGNFNGGMHLERSGEILGRFAVLTRIRRVIPHHRSFFLWDDFHFAVEFQGQPTGQRQLAQLCVNLRVVLRMEYGSGSTFQWFNGARLRSRRHVPLTFLPLFSPMGVCPGYRNHSGNYFSYISPTPRLRCTSRRWYR